MSQGSPALSIGLAVRNATDVVGRCVESVLSQDFADIELVICDNVSDDGTIEVDSGLRSLGSPDRVQHQRRQHRLAREHEAHARALPRPAFRWISADDWLQPGCLSTCVHALESRPDAVGVTTWFTIHADDGSTRYDEYRGEFPTSPDPARRFERMLWFFHAGDATYDPVYGMFRREALMRAHPLRPSERTDWLLSAELALMSPIIHVHERLANRTRDYAVGVDRGAFRRRLDPVRSEQLKTTPRRLYRELYALAVSADLSPDQLRRCRRALRRFWAKEVARSARSRAADARHRASAADGRSRAPAPSGRRRQPPRPARARPRARRGRSRVGRTSGRRCARPSRRDRRALCSPWEA